ncbi:erythromycin esterase family protein [Streptomyces sp. NPDC059874]|uniref:erythromycin esterase family protein n=1 Tax=Streptomyces sp. NPDC059874 TaxID=3346983 RepID=UPI003663ADAA
MVGLCHARLRHRSAWGAIREPALRLFVVGDRYVAEAVTALVDGAAGRVAVWAHDGHIAKGAYAAGVPALGSLLRRRHGDAYYALGLLFGKGQFRARRGNDTTGPADRYRIGGAGRSVESRLAAALPGDYLVDLRGGRRRRHPPYRNGCEAPASNAASVPTSPRFTYRFHLAPRVPAEEYDGLAFVAKVDLLPSRVPMGTWDSSGAPSALRTTALGMASPSTISSPALPFSRTSTLPNRGSSTGT